MARRIIVFSYNESRQGRRLYSFQTPPCSSSNDNYASDMRETADLHGTFRPVFQLSFRHKPHHYVRRTNTLCSAQITPRPIIPDAARF